MSKRRDKSLPPVPPMESTRLATAPLLHDSSPPTRLPVRSRTASTPKQFHAAGNNLKEKGRQFAVLASSWRGKAMASVNASAGLGISSLNAPWNKRATSTPSPSAPEPACVTVLGVQVPRDATPGLVFGRTLQDAALATRLASPEPRETLSRVPSMEDPRAERERERREARAWLPAVAIRCLEYIELYADTEEGLFRVPGSNQQVQQLKMLFDAGLDVDLRSKNTSDLDPHSVASLFKLWLRELPESILTPTLEPMLDRMMLEEIGTPATSKQSLTMGANTPSPTIRTSKSSADPPRDLVDKMSILISTLPLERWHLLRELANHLHILDSHSDKTKMTLSNLRLILSPTLRVSPALLQILVERRAQLFDKQRAHALATPTASPHSSKHPSSAHSDHMARFPSYQDPSPVAGSAPATFASVFQTQQAAASLSPHLYRSDSTHSTPTPISQKFISTSARSSSSDVRSQSPAGHQPPFIPQRSPNLNFFSNNDSKSRIDRPRRPSAASTHSHFELANPPRRISSVSSLRPGGMPAPLPYPAPDAALPEPNRSTPELSNSSADTQEEDPLSDPEEEVIEDAVEEKRPRVPSLAPSISLSSDLEGEGLFDGFLRSETWMQSTADR